MGYRWHGASPASCRKSKRFEIRREQTPSRPTLRRHRRRFWLLATAGFLISLFVAPAAQFRNRFLSDERGYSATRISLFILATNTPGGIGVLAGGRLADVYGRRIIGATALIVGLASSALVFTAHGWPIWAWGTAGSIIGAAYVPAMGVYGPELFPTRLRGLANGWITVVAVLGSATGLIVAGILADRFDALGPAMLILLLGPAACAVLIIAAYPETARIELEELNPEDR